MNRHYRRASASLVRRMHRAMRKVERSAHNSPADKEGRIHFAMLFVRHQKLWGLL